jgi:hypothetical protein
MLLRISVFLLMVIMASLSPSLQAQESETQESVADAPLPAFPNNCEVLPLVGGEGSEVTKEVSPPSVRIPLPGPASAGTRNNWHTDWFLSGQNHESYMVILMPHNNREYDISMYLKYPDNTNQRFYREQRIELFANQPVTVTVIPDRTDIAPFQVNTNIGGVQAVGARYTVAAAGCR